jgi:hypothetical protein
VWYYNSPHSTQPVATKKPNAWGLYDMSGNLWEWCNDLYSLYSTTSQINPTGAPSNSNIYRVLRGGSWGDGYYYLGFAYYLCAAYRNCGSCYFVGDYSYAVGFRVVCGALFPSVPMLNSPTNGAVNQPTAPTFSWGTVSGAASYMLQLSTASSFSNTISSQNGITSGNANVGGLANSTTFFWQVNATNAGGTSAWSSVWSFTVGSTAVLPLKASVLSKGISFTNTAIIYDLHAASSVSIALYDMQGRQVRQLVNAMQNAGLYRINFSRAKVTAGYYIVEFKAGSFVIQKRLALID